MADWQYGMLSKSSGGGRSKVRMRGDDQEFEEDDVWSLVRNREAEDFSSPNKIKNRHSASKMIPRSSAATTTTSLIKQSSAPVSIPDWSKIYGSRNGSKWDHEHDCVLAEDQDHDHGYDDEMVPPHEWVARKLAGTGISCFSMCEGIGRTLKGRDLSKVRNAVLTKTGFLE